jgi:hypothetical protein
MEAAGVEELLKPDMEAAGVEELVEPDMEAAGVEEPEPRPRTDSSVLAILNKKCYVYIIMKYFIYAAKKPLNREINFPIR